MLMNDPEAQRTEAPTILIVGNYCHDVLMENSSVRAESLGGAVAFISNVLVGMSVACKSVSKVGTDFGYVINPVPITIPSSKTTAFHACFCSGSNDDFHDDRILRRTSECDPIHPTDLPNARFDLGMAVGVGGEISAGTLQRMMEICEIVLVDMQAVIRVFDADDGSVKHVRFQDTGFYPLLHRIGFLKASSYEATFMDLEEVRKWCCVIVTNGKEGCRLYWKDGGMAISPFLVHKQQDPTGAGDSFLGGFVAGLAYGLAVSDAAMLGNLFGSLTVEQIGLPKYDSRLLQRIREEVLQRKSQDMYVRANRKKINFSKPEGHEMFLSSLTDLKNHYS